MLPTSALCFGFGRWSEAQTKPGTNTAEQGNKQPRIVALKPGEPESLAYGADGAVGSNRVRFLATGEDTGGERSLVELTETPGTKTTWHRHNRTDQAYTLFRASDADRGPQLNTSVDGRF